MTITRTFLLILALVPCCRGAVPSPSPLPAGTTFLSSGPDGLQLEIRTPAHHVVSPADGAGSRLVVDGWGRTGVPGEPDLPAWTTFLQVPPEGEVRVNVESFDPEEFPGFSPVITPRLEVSGDGGRPGAPEARPLPEPPPGTYPASGFLLGPREHFRGTCLVRLTVFPFRWDSRTRSLLKAGRTVIDVRFDQALGGNRAGLPPDAPTSAGEALFEGIKRDLLPNRTPDADIPVSPAEQPLPAAPGLETDAVRMDVRRDGVVRVTYDALAAAGAPLGEIDPATLSLSCGGLPVAFQTSGEGGGFGPGDALLFGGRALDTIYTDTNVYWLTWGGTPGPRLETRDGAPDGSEPLVDQFYRSIRFEQNNLYWSIAPGAPESDYWLWQKLTAPVTASYTLQVPSPVTNQGGIAQVYVNLLGRSDTSPHPNHHTVVTFNTSSSTEIFWDGVTDYTASLTPPMALVKDGANTLSIQLPGGDGFDVDIIYLNRIEMIYRSRLRAENDRLDFDYAVQGPVVFEVDGFTVPPIRVFDVTDADHAVEITGVEVLPAGAGFKARFACREAGARKFVALAENVVPPPARLQLRHPQHLGSPANGADLLIVTAEEFLPALAPLVDFRRGQGMRVFPVSVEAVYDAFNHGVVHPGAIRDFLRTAYRQWQPPRPAYVLLLGDANFDYRGYLPETHPSRVPLYPKYTAGLGLTPVDNWYVCLEGDDPFPEMFIGRIPAVGSAAVTEVVEKIVGYEGRLASAPPTIVLSAHKDDPSFEQVSEQVSQLIPPNFAQDKVYLSEYASTNLAKNDLYAGFNAGAVIANWVGHGSLFYWSGVVDSISDMGRLQAGMPLMFMVSTACLNGHIGLLSSYCLAESFLAVPGKGAAGCFMSSGLTYDWENQEIDLRFFRNLFRNGSALLGPLTLQARLEAYRNGATMLAVDTYELFGDPVMRLRTVPEGDVNADGVLNAEDLLVMAQAMAGVVREGVPPCTVPAAGDFNRNLHLDALDLLRAQGILTGAIPFP
ncbi:MAG: hypothetical protein KA419_11365 [Acidobacteria bacterium]|nr:hypothetical protein [Acidobacteriota bacterium]